MSFSLALLYPNSRGNDDIHTDHARLSVRCLTLLRSNEMKCPVCKTTDLLMTERRSIEIDYCPVCRGIWLDRGELDKLIAQDAGSDDVQANATARTSRDSYPDRDRDRDRERHRDHAY